MMSHRGVMPPKGSRRLTRGGSASSGTSIVLAAAGVAVTLLLLVPGTAEATWWWPSSELACGVLGFGFGAYGPSVHRPFARCRAREKTTRANLWWSPRVCARVCVCGWQGRARARREQSSGSRP